MKVLKFGGSSVANAANIQKVVNIVKCGSEPPQQSVIVVSALGGVTDMLIKAGTLAESADESYKAVLHELEVKHLDAARELLPVTTQSSCLSMVKQHFNELDDICEGVFRLQEL